MARRLHGLIGALTLLALSIGLPVVLAATIGDPLHSWSGIRAGDMSDTDVIAIMAAVAYLAWATFALALGVELIETIAARLGSRPRRQIHLPLLGPQQDLARTLIAAVLLLAPVVAASVGPVMSAFAAPPAPVAVHRLPPTHPTPRSGAAEPAEATEAATMTYVIPDRGGMRSYWALAEHYLGDGTRWTDIWDLNRGRHQGDGTVMDTPRRLYSGWTVRIPATGRQAASAAAAPPAGSHDVTVEPGDTLAGLAAADGVTDWETVWPANARRAEPGGARFTDPNLIRPGWSIVLPDDGSRTPSPATTAKAVPRPDRHRHTPDRDGSQSESPGAARRDPGVDTPPGKVATPPPVAAGTASSHPDSPKTRSAPDTEHPANGYRRQHSDVGMVAFAGGGGVLLAGVSLAALAGYRRRQFRRRRPGRAISRTPADLVGTERSVLAAGNAGAADVTWLDRALRALVQEQAARDGAELPDVIAVSLTDDLLTLVLHTPARDAPTSWQVAPDGTRWSVRRGDPLGYDEASRAFFFAPYPTLVSVGHTDQGEHWLVDLERIAALSMAGDPKRSIDLMRFLAAELAHNTWSEMLRVTLVGFGSELVEANPDRLTCTDDLDGAVSTLHAQLAAVTQAMEGAKVDVLSGRLRDVSADRWAPHVLLVAPHAAADNAGLDRLLVALADQDSRTSVAVVIGRDAAAAPPAAAGWDLIVDRDGRLRIPALDLDLIAEQIPAQEAAQLARMLALAAVTDDQPVPASRGEARWDAYADACGGLTVTAAVPTVHSADSPAPGGESLLPLSSGEYLAQTAATEDDLRALAPPVDGMVRAQVEAGDPDLDVDLADWFDPACPRPRLRLLGSVEVRAQGLLPDRNPRRAFHTEIVAYLATRTGGVLSDRYAMAMWPDEVDIVGKTKVRQSVSTVRAWLGRDAVTGTEYLPSGLHDAGTARYRINGILIDAELFRRLRLRGTARGSDGIADLHRALDLVAGPPFDELPAGRAGSPGGYSWLVDSNSRLDHEYAAMIVDVAHLLATHHLAAGEPELAERAAKVALRAGSYEDTPLLDLVAASDAIGNPAEADAYIKRILSNHDADVEEDLPPRTADVLFRRQRINRAS